MLSIGWNLKKARTAKGLTLAEAAERCDMSLSQFSQYECGAKMPSAMMLKRLADGLQVSVASLYEEFDK